jgi:hypothetical protein
VDTQFRPCGVRHAGFDENAADVSALLGNVADEVVDPVPIRHFDGASTWT